jgi:hypothetical protein
VADPAYGVFHTCFGVYVRMPGLFFLLVTVGVPIVSVAVMHHAAHADELWPFGRARDAAVATPHEAMTAEELTDYVRGGLADLAVMLAQAARRRSP